MLKEQVYWHDTVEMPSGAPLEPPPAKVDVAILGGGLTGLSSALILAKRGLRTAIFDSHDIGWGGSSRNGGMVLTGLKIPMQTAIRRYGREMARRLFQCSQDSITMVERLVRENHIQCGFQRCGHLLVANKPAHYRSLAAEVDFMAGEFGHHVRLVPREAQHSEIGSGLYQGALLDETSAGLNPAQYVAGMARTAEEAGTGLYPQTRVRRVSRSGGDFLVETERGALHAGQVFVATNGYIDGATPSLQRKIIPIGSFIIATEPLNAVLADELIPQRRMVFDYRHFLNYFRLSDDNRMVFGGRAAFFPETERTVHRSAEILQREMLQVYPQLRDVKIEYTWGGTLGFAFDLMPHAGQLDGMYYALGYAGHGVAMATYLGVTVAEAMLAGSIKAHPFASFPFPNAPLNLYNGRPWFLPFIGLWHRLLDVLN